MKQHSVCTLFEKDYHLGLAVFINSLAAYGFEGTIYAGYKGTLPPWLIQLKAGKEAQSYILTEKINLLFIELHTEKHLTNYKPDFMLDILNIYDVMCETLFYFDPDIVIKNDWNIFVNWIQWGPLLCEDINSPLDKSHPLRKLWIDCYKRYGVKIQSNKDVYVNGGFVGLRRCDVEFLEYWKRIQEIMSEELGGLKDWGIKDRTFLFSMTDQDALNISIMRDREVSVLGRNAMDIIPGGYIMSHAIGAYKPWRNRYVSNAFKGISPSMTDKLFWQYSNHFLKPYSSVELMYKKTTLKIASLISRFIKR